MKSYLSGFLLFLLLLVDKSLSARFPPSTKVMFKKIKLNFSPPQPNEPPLQQIQGLSLIKEYLSIFGYLQSYTFDDYLDEETITAIKTYQQYFNLQPTGNLNYETLNQILLPRCSVPDMNFDYLDFSDKSMSWPEAAKPWFPKGKSNLTYGFNPGSKISANMTKVFTDAFTRWAHATTVVLVNLTETTYDSADIKVGFNDFSDNVKDVVFGSSIIRLLQPAASDDGATTAATGEVRLDDSQEWALPSGSDLLSLEDGVLDLESAAMHQIGHLLGLDHSNEEDSVMYPYILPSRQRKVELSVSDKNNIQQQYSNGNSGRRIGRWGVVLITTFTLGFAYVVPLY